MVISRLEILVHFIEWVLSGVVSFHVVIDFFIQIGPQRTVGESIHRMVVQDNPDLDTLYKVHCMEILECWLNVQFQNKDPKYL